MWSRPMKRQKVICMRWGGEFFGVGEAAMRVVGW